MRCESLVTGQEIKIEESEELPENAESLILEINQKYSQNVKIGNNIEIGIQNLKREYDKLSSKNDLMKMNQNNVSVKSLKNILNQINQNGRMINDLMNQGNLNVSRFITTVKENNDPDQIMMDILDKNLGQRNAIKKLELLISQKDDEISRL